jgi:hypothetical protein
MIQPAREQRQRVDAERRAELVVAEPQQLLQLSRARALADVAFRVDRRIVAESTQPDRSNGRVPAGEPSAGDEDVLTPSTIVSPSSRAAGP